MQRWRRLAKTIRKQHKNLYLGTYALFKLRFVLILVGELPDQCLGSSLLFDMLATKFIPTLLQNVLTGEFSALGSLLQYANRYIMNRCESISYSSFTNMLPILIFTNSRKWIVHHTSQLNIGNWSLITWNFWWKLHIILI